MSPVVGTDVPAAYAAQSGASANGHGNLVQLPAGTLRTFSFHVRVMPDGSVRGEYDNHNRQGGFVNHGDIDCIRFIAPNAAVISGVVRRSTNPASPPGTIGIFRVEDNGEGENAAEDRISLISLLGATSGRNCMNFTPTAMSEIVGGNVQVRP